MRMRTLVRAGWLITGAAALAGTALAAPRKPAAPARAPADPGAAAAAASGALSPSALIAYYPPAALAARVEGEATLNCAANDHLALKDCQLVSEVPAGQGFGQAALRMAALSKDNPKIARSNAAATLRTSFTIVFRLDPKPLITPNVTGWRHVVVHPEIKQGPDATAMLNAIPPRAARSRTEGEARLQCKVTRAGALTGCTVAEESPEGFGFGAAALMLAPSFVMTPEIRDGDPVDGGDVTLPIAFRAPPPAETAPAETAPANAAAPAPAP